MTPIPTHIKIVSNISISSNFIKCGKPVCEVCVGCSFSQPQVGWKHFQDKEDKI